MDDFGKFQPNETADDKSCNNVWPLVSLFFFFLFFFLFFKSFLCPFNNAFVVSVKL